ncbi:MAG: ABC transporter permease [Lachnospiraceae bacterium]|nr:ABC transporter permease [Lachnospiraceae bacterium]
MKRNTFAGTGKVFRFTLVQLLKSKANIRSMIIMLILALASIPLLSLIRGNAGETSSVSTIYIDNQSSVSLTGLPKYLEESGYGSVDVKEGEMPEKAKDAAAFRIAPGEDGRLNVETAAGSSAGDLGTASLIASYVYRQQLLAAGFTEKQIDTLTSSPDHWADTRSGYVKIYEPAPGENGELSPISDEDFSFDQGRYNVQLGFSVLLMMVCILSVSFVIRSVVEEKASKLVDLLMVSVEPGALLLGKVLASLVYALLYYVILLGGAALSRAVTGLFMDISGTNDFLANTLRLDLAPDKLAVLLITSFLGFLAFGILAGLSGAGCASLEDSSGAMSLCMFLIMAGYMVSIFATALGSAAGGGMANAFCIIPVLSMFSAPTMYMYGTVGIVPIVIGWAVQLVFIFLLLRLAARVYANLIIYKGKRLGFGRILQMGLGKGARS